MAPGRSPSRSTCFLSQLLGKRVLGSGGVLGRVDDVLATLSPRHPDIDGVVVTRGATIGFVPMQPAALLAMARSAQGTVDLAAAQPLAPTDHQFLVRETLYDKQIVDVTGARIRRVNDIQLAMLGSSLSLMHVDVGITGLLRRLGYEATARRIVRLFGAHMHDEFIRWKSVLAFPESRRGPLQVSLRQEQIRQLHAGELADIIEELDHDERLALLSGMDIDDAADALEEVDGDVRTSVLRDLEPGRAADLLEKMESAVAADAVDELGDDAAAPILDHMEEGEREGLELLAQAGERTAAALMSVDYVTCPASATVGAAFDTLRAEAPNVEELSYVYCVEDGHLVGVVSMRDLLLGPPDAPLSTVMNTRVTALAVDDPWERVADDFLKYHFKALPVLDAEGSMCGVVTFRHSFAELVGIYHRQGA